MKRELCINWSNIFSESICDKEVPSFSKTKVNTHIFFGVRAVKPLTNKLGKAYLGGACETKPSRAYMHCAMMEYEDSDIEFARVRTS